MNEITVRYQGMKICGFLAWSVVGFVILVNLMTLPVQAQSLSLRLQQAQFTEEAEGDLDSAMQLYRAIIDEANSNRRVAAQALYRLGLCHLKRDQNEEAEQAFHQAILEAPDQTEIVEASRAQLKAMNALTAQVSIKTVLSSTEQESFGLLSPDETKVAYVDWDKEKKADLIVKDLRTGAKVAMTTRDYRDPDRYEFANFNFNNGGAGAWSRDSEWLAYLWFAVPDDPEVGAHSMPPQLRIAKADGSETKVLQNARMFSPFDWSPDGRLLAGAINDKNADRSAAGVMDVESLEVESIDKLDGIHARFSPDGAWIVSDWSENDESDIVLVQLKTKRRIRLSMIGSVETRPIFSKTGRHIYFSSNRRGPWDLWGVSFNEEGVLGDPFLAKTEIVNARKRSTTSGKILLNHSYRSWDVYASAVSLDSTLQVGAPLRLSGREAVNEHRALAWSPDSDHIAYARDRNILVIQSRLDGTEEIVQTDMESISQLCWRPGKRMFAIGGRSPHGRGNYVFDVESGKRRLIAGDPYREPGWLNGWSGDGREIHRSYKDWKTKAVVCDVDDDTWRNVQVPGYEGDILYYMPSPKTRSILFIPADQASLKLYDGETGSIHSVDERENVENAQFWDPQWSRDGRFFSCLLSGLKESELRIYTADLTNRGKVSVPRGMAVDLNSHTSWSAQSDELGFVLKVGPVGEILAVSLPE